MKHALITAILAATLMVVTLSTSSAQTVQAGPESVHTLLRELIDGEQLKRPKSTLVSISTNSATPPNPAVTTQASTPSSQSTTPALPQSGVASQPQNPASDLPPYQSTLGMQCIESWITTTLQHLNSYSGAASFNENKPYRVNRFGFIFGSNARSNYEPDNWTAYGATRNSYMWKFLYTSTVQWPNWRNADYNAAGVPGLRYFVTLCVAGNTSIAQAPPPSPTGQSQAAASTTPPVKPAPTATQTTPRCRTTEWGEEDCDSPEPSDAINTAAADAAIDRVNQSRPQPQTIGENGDDGISIDRPTNPDTTWTADDPRNDPGPVVTSRRGQNNSPGIAEEFGDPSDPDFSAHRNPHNRPRNPSVQQCKTRGNDCHLRSDGSCHCPDETSHDGSTLAGTATNQSSESSPDTDDAELAGSGKRFYVIRKSGTGWRKMWAGAAHRIEGYQSSFIIEIDPAIDELKKLYTHWAYPEKFNLAVEATKWQAESRESDLGWCETKSPALCPCAYQPDIWTSGPHFEIYAGPLDTLDEAIEARGDIGSNAKDGSAYQWLYSDGNYEDINNACAQIETGQSSTEIATGKTNTGNAGDNSSTGQSSTDQDISGESTNVQSSTDTSSAGTVAPCHSDSNLPVDASWAFYRRIYGGGHTSYFEKGGHICYGSSYYYEYQGESMRGFDCDRNWENCVADPDGVYIYKEIVNKDNGDKTYIYSNGSAWGNRRPL